MLWAFLLSKGCMKTIKFPDIINHVLAHIDKNVAEFWQESDFRNSGLSFRFSYVRVHTESDLYRSIAAVLQQHGYSSIKGLRLNIFNSDDFIGAHEDSVFAGHKTLIVPVVLGVPRLRVILNGCSVLLGEQPMLGIILDEKLVHEVLQAEDTRITICGWVA